MLDTIEEYTEGGMLEAVAGALGAGAVALVIGTTATGAVEVHQDGIVMTVTVAATQVEAPVRIESAHELL